MSSHELNPPKQKGVNLEGLGRGYGTRPDYLVNRDDRKNEGPFGGKIARKSRNGCRVNGRGCGCTGTVDSRCNFAQS